MPCLGYVCVFRISKTTDKYPERRYLDRGFASARPTPWCSQRCWLKAGPPTPRLNLPSLQSSANIRTEAKRHRHYCKTHFGSSAEKVMFDLIWFSPDLHFSELDRLKLSGKVSAGHCCGPTPSRSFCTGGELAAWSPKCRRVHGSLPWWKKYIFF